MTKKKTVADAIHSQYYSITNMTASELKAWAKTPLSKKASLNRKPILRAIRLKSKHKTKWTIKDLKDAILAISYLKRARKIKSRKKVDNSKYTRNQIALKNWGYDVHKR